MSPAPLHGLFALLLFGCGVSDQVISNGPIQKRKHRPGWHIDLRVNTNRESPVNRESLRELQPRRFEPGTLNTPTAIPEPMEAVAVVVPHASPDPGTTMRSNIPVFHEAAFPRASNPSRVGEDSTNPVVQNEAQRGSRAFSVMATIALFMGVLAAAGLEFEMAMVMGCLAILFGIMGLIRVKGRKKKGKALCIVAIVIGTVLALIASTALMFDYPSGLF